MGIVEIFLGTKYGYSGVNMQYNNNTENQEEYQRERKNKLHADIRQTHVSCGVASHAF